MTRGVGKPFALALEIAGKLRITVDGEQVAEFGLAGRTMNRDWSFAYSGMVWLSDVRCEPLAPAKK